MLLRRCWQAPVRGSLPAVRLCGPWPLHPWLAWLAWPSTAQVRTRLDCLLLLLLLCCTASPAALKAACRPAVRRVPIKPCPIGLLASSALASSSPIPYWTSSSRSQALLQAVGS